MTGTDLASSGAGAGTAGVGNAREGAGSASASAGKTGSLGGAIAAPSPAEDSRGALADDVATRVSRVTPPRVLTTAGMDYPGDAFRLTVRRQDLGSGILAVAGAEGTVGLRALVLADGTVRDVEVVASSGSAVLDRTAVEAVHRWRFAPAARDSVPIDAYVTLKIRYVVR